MEQVFVVQRRDFFGGRWPQGFVPLEGDAAASLLGAFCRAGFFEPRAAAEENPEWKQLIPYCVVRRPGHVFCVQRKAAQSEGRLHGKLSIGIGGHVNPDSGSPAAEGFLRHALMRELAEELHGTATQGFAPCFLGILNDDGNAVGQVHAGLVYAVDLPARDSGGEPLRVRERSKMEGGFRGLAELRPLWQDPGRFESWSRILIEAGVAGSMAVSRVSHNLSRHPDNESEESNG